MGRQSKDHIYCHINNPVALPTAILHKWGSLVRLSGSGGAQKDVWLQNDSETEGSVTAVQNKKS